MNELGMTLAWLAIQVTFLGLPSLALHALATRRGPTSGAWVAGLSLGLVVVLSVSAFFAGQGRWDRRLAEAGRKPVLVRASGALPGPPPAAIGQSNSPGRSRPSVRHGWGIAELRVVWSRIEHGAAEPAARTRPWANVLAVVALAGSCVGLLRLAIGLWAVRAWRRNGRPVDDPEMSVAFDDLRRTMGCTLPVAIREVPDLTTPATAGWWRPTILLPEHWRSWSHHERRAVLAHELAHIIRGDYAVGLLARLAVALNYYHPVVRWIAGRLQLQQEQAADAFGAQYAGGRARYLLALLRLALEQDGRSQCWPAREFLPGRGTLIRRIAMLRDRNQSGSWDRPLPGGWRFATAFVLLGLTAGVALLHGPARGDDQAPSPAASKVRAQVARAADAPITPPYVNDSMAGLIAFRPAATFRRIDTGVIVPLLAEFWGIDFTEFPKEYQAITSKPGALKLGVEDIEWVTSSIGFGRGKNSDGDVLHSFMLGAWTVRTTAPFDWLTFLRQWQFGFDEARINGRVYYKLTGPLKEALAPDPCVCLLDDRTAVFDEEKAIRTFLGRGSAQAPTYLRSPEWERASQGLLAVAFTNENGAFAKQYDLGRTDDKVTLSLFKDVDHWTIGVDDADSIVLHAAAACRNGAASAAITGVADSLLKLAREGMTVSDPEALPAGPHERAYRMIKTLLANTRVEHTDRSVDLRTTGFGTLAEFGRIVLAQYNEFKSRMEAEQDKPKGSSR